MRSKSLNELPAALRASTALLLAVGSFTPYEFPFPCLLFLYFGELAAFAAAALAARICASRCTFCNNC